MIPAKEALYNIDPSTLDWQKASLTGNNGNCVELAALPEDGVAIRDSKRPHGPHLCFNAAEWAAFIGGYERGEFDHLRNT